MKTGPKGIALIKQFEGWRATAYRDAVGVWTIGYGHTSMAGAPLVTKGMKITKAEGEAILKRDLRKYEDAVLQAVKRDLTQEQFDALVSFCYNVGPSNFRKSSVLRYVNRGDFDAVPARLMLWNKAGGKVLRGLTRRRAAEGELFISGTDANDDRAVPDVPRGKPALKSTTNIAAGLSAAAGVSAATREITDNTSAVLSAGNVFAFVAILVIVLATLWVFRERIRKSLDDGI